jgi:hypothetical protein
MLRAQMQADADARGICICLPRQQKVFAFLELGLVWFGLVKFLVSLG